jgi:hypothetical protein
MVSAERRVRMMPTMPPASDRGNGPKAVKAQSDSWEIIGSGSARRLELGTVSAEPLSRAYWSQNSGRSAKRLACRARTSGESPDSTQAGRGPQWPIHRISAPANDAVRLPGARRLERQMTVTDGRAGHFRTVSAVVCVRPGAVEYPNGRAQTVGHRPGDRGRAHGGQSTARSYSPGRLPPRARRSTAAAAPQQFGPTSCGLRPRRQPNPFISSPTTKTPYRARARVSRINLSAAQQPCRERWLVLDRSRGITDDSGHPADMNQPAALA